MPQDSNRPNIGLAHLLRAHAASLAIGLVAVIVEGIASLAEPWPLKIVLDSVLMTKSGGSWLNQFIVSTTGTDKIAILKLASLAVLLIAAVGAVGSYTEKYVTISVGQYLTQEVRQTLFGHIQQLPLEYHDHKQVGDLLGCLTGDVDAIQSFITTGLLGALVNGLTLLGMMSVMFYLNWRFTLIALSVAPLLFVVVSNCTRRIRKASREARKSEAQMVSVMQEALSSMRVVKAFAREELEQQRVAKESYNSVRIALRVRNLKARLSPIVDMIVASGTSLVLWFGGRMALKGTISAGSVVLFIWYLGKMYKPMRDLSKMADTYARAVVGYERIREVLETDPLQAKDLPGARIAHKFRGSIRLDDVGFGYRPDYLVLKKVSFTVEPGQVVALVGPSGAGKTTIVSLIPRFYDPNVGTVNIDGVDVRQFQRKSLRRQISFVLQETLLFRGTVSYNIAYGNPDASQADIERSAKQANAHEFIKSLPHGYDTVLGERGMTLSGGQRQRIAIARAVIRNAPILVLDEPSIGLDAVSEKLVLEALDRLMKDKTTIVVAHKLSTVRGANVIYVVNDGEIVEFGDHTSLLRMGGFYAEMYELQSEVKSQVPAWKIIDRDAAPASL